MSARERAEGRRGRGNALRTGIAGSGLFAGSPMEFIDQGPAAVIRRVREGVPYDAVVTLAETLGLGRERLVELVGLPKSTLKARRTANKPLSAIEGDRMVRVGNVLNRAVEVLENLDFACRWIKQDNRALGGVSPLSLLDTEAGYQLVMDTLARIEHGIVA